MWDVGLRSAEEFRRWDLVSGVPLRLGGGGIIGSVPIDTYRRAHTHKKNKKTNHLSDPIRLKYPPPQPNTHQLAEPARPPLYTPTTSSAHPQTTMSTKSSTRCQHKHGPKMGEIFTSQYELSQRARQNMAPGRG